jgi:hypothetical protein
VVFRKFSTMERGGEGSKVEPDPGNYNVGGTCAMKDSRTLGHRLLIIETRVMPCV